MDRRDALVGLGVGGVAAILAGRARAAEPPLADRVTRRSAFAGDHAVVPLPFDPAKLDGLSEKLLVSHHDNNYAAAVANLNKVEKDLAAVTKDTPGYVVNGLKERELTYTNSRILHETYFGNLGGDGKAGGDIARRLSESYGSVETWEAQFRATGGALGGGSGWVVLDLNLHDGDIRTYWSSGHAVALAAGVPLLVMDMYEHAYQMDYGAAAAKYVDAFFKNLHWDVVTRRLERAEKALLALHG